MKSRMIAILMLFCMLVSAAPAQAYSGATLSVSEESVVQGETTEVTIQISGNPGMAAWMFEVVWDTSALSLDTSDGLAVAGDSFASGTLLAKQTDTGLKVSWFNVKDNDADGVLFTFRVTASDTAGTYPITVICSEENTVNTREEHIAIRTGSGNIKITDTDTGNSESAAPPETPNDKYPPTDDTAPHPLPNTNPFLDVADSAFYHDAVLWAVSRSITTGTSPTTFSPNATCTRAQTVTFLWRAAGSPEPVVMNNPFSDVAPGSYYYKAVLWAAENGITGGTSANTFSPDTTVTRAQVVTFLWRAADSQKADGDNPFTDIVQDQYYSEAVQWAVASGITSGTSATTFSPHSGCTRGQIATFLFRSYTREEISK